MNRFRETHYQGFCQSLLTGDLHAAARHTARRCPCISAVLEATHEASRGSLKSTVSAEKALQGSKTETRELLGGTEENSVSPMRDFYKMETEKIELVTRPGNLPPP